jgi:GNAT superfamily N-acetyltransferase
VTVEVRPVNGRGERGEFVRLPFSLHRGHAAWVPPLLYEERRFFDARTNLAFGYSDVRLALAHRNGAVVGRIAGIVNRRANAVRGERTARFGFLECTEDQEVAGALLGHVEDWARGLGMDRVVGPMGFSDQDPEGLWIEGFGSEPTLATYANFPYVAPLLAAAGYEKEVDYVVYALPVPNEPTEAQARIRNRLLARRRFRLVPVRSRRDVRRLALPVLRVMNEAFQHLYGYVSLEEREMETLAKRYVPVIDPRFLKVVSSADGIAGFVLGVPNMDPGFRAANGRLFPLGVLRILAAARRSKQFDLLLAGVRPRWWRLGLTALLGAELLESVRDAGFETADSHLILETNERTRSEMERLGGRLSKRYRIFRKAL